MLHWGNKKGKQTVTNKSLQRLKSRSKLSISWSNTAKYVTDSGMSYRREDSYPSYKVVFPNTLHHTHLALNPHSLSTQEVPEVCRPADPVGLLGRPWVFLGSGFPFWINPLNSCLPKRSQQNNFIIARYGPFISQQPW